MKSKSVLADDLGAKGAAGGRAFELVVLLRKLYRKRSAYPQFYCASFLKRVLAAYIATRNRMPSSSHT